MKVILTQDVPKVGDLGTIQDVRDGYARNFLIPQGLARIATPGMIRQVEERQEAERRRIAALEDDMRELAEQIDGIRLEIQARVGEQGRLFGSVTSADIAGQLSEIAGTEIDRRKVDLEAPIRQIGEVSVPIRLVGRLAPTITVSVFDPAQPMLAVEPEEEEDEDEVDEADVYQVEVEGIEAEIDQIAGTTEELVVDPEAEPVADADAAEEDDEDSA